MLIVNKKLLLWAFWVIPGILIAQREAFISPLTRPLRLSGTFGELRPDHFHSGIDIKTNQEEGWPVLAIADGFISRIAISPTGYGKALYIDHPDGYTSVYAHLQRMNGEIQNYVTRQQYASHSFKIDITLQPGELIVKKGDTIAFSGNTGSSGGPHLHFEIRDSRTQQALDPLEFGFYVKDWIRPTLNFIKVYPEGEGSWVENSMEPLIFYLAGWGPHYRLRDKDTLYIAGRAWFGISAHDLLVDEPNKNGVKSVQMFIDSAEVFSVSFHRLSFDKSRYINSFCDYLEFYQTGRWVMQTRLSPCNELDIYNTLKDRGIYSFEAGKIYKVYFVVQDYFKNESVLRFTVKGIKPLNAPFVLNRNLRKQFTCDQTAHFDTSGFSFEAPARAFYDTVQFHYQRIASPPAFYSDFHKVHYPTTPIHKPCKIALAAERLPARLKSKALIVRVNERGKPIAAGGTWKQDQLTTTIRSFGTYSVLADTLAPVIRWIYPGPNKILQGKNLLRVKISDDLSGVSFYEATLNGNWILMEYDAKNNLLTYRPDEWIKEGDNILKIHVRDGVGNNSFMEYKLKYKP